MTNYSVAPIGFSERERRVLHSMFSLSKSRTPSFASYDLTQGGVADIVVLDVDNLRAVNGWQAYRRTHGHAVDIPVIEVARQVTEQLASGNDAGYFLVRPIIATRLLSLLERVALESLDAAPTLAIDPKDLPAPAAHHLEVVTEAAQPDANEAPVVPAAEGHRVLVVDDSLPVRIQMKLALLGLVARADFAESGEDAYELLGEHRYDIVFLDVVLPGADGYEICRHIKGSAATKNTPVIMLTSNSSPADRMKGLLAGCDSYLVKPVKRDVFEQTVREYLFASSAA